MRQYIIHLQIIIFAQETVAAGKNRFAPELNEKEVIELLEDLSSILGAFLIKQLLHSRLLDTVMIIANACSWNNC